MPHKTGILLDIEGTTTPIHFVYDVLFPYVRRRLDSYRIPNHLEHALRAEHDRESDAGLWTSPASYVTWLMDRDRKSTALKELQGLIWQDGYRNGELRGQVFVDVPPSLKDWRDSGIDIRIFSSGSILAQQLLFSTTSAGDLTQLLNGYFDTTTGSKVEQSSYERIAATFEVPAADILFISDVVGELQAAESAGMRVTLCVRPGNHPQPPNSFDCVSSFADIKLRQSWQRG